MNMEFRSPICVAAQAPKHTTSSTIWAFVGTLFITGLGLWNFEKHRFSYYCKNTKNGPENQVRDLLLCSESWSKRNTIEFWLICFDFLFVTKQLVFETKIANLTWDERWFAKMLPEFGFSVRSYTDLLDDRLLTRYLTPFREGPKLDPFCSVKF